MPQPTLRESAAEWAQLVLVTNAHGEEYPAWRDLRAERLSPLPARAKRHAIRHLLNDNCYPDQIYGKRSAENRKRAKEDAEVSENGTPHPDLLRFKPPFSDAPIPTPDHDEDPKAPRPPSPDPLPATPTQKLF